MKQNALLVAEETNTSLAVHFLYLTRARKKSIEAKLGRSFSRHARQEGLSDDELRERLAGVRA